MNLNEALGIDMSDPIQRHANDLVDACHGLLNDLKAHRIARSITVYQVAERMGISVSDVIILEGYRGTDMRLSALRRYALAIGADVAFTITRRTDVE